MCIQLALRGGQLISLATQPKEFRNKILGYSCINYLTLLLPFGIKNSFILSASIYVIGNSFSQGLCNVPREKGREKWDED